MKKFNINDYIYIQITELGWKHLKETVGHDYIKHCIDTESYRKEIGGQIWYRLQAHHAFELLPTTDNSKILYNTTIMIDDSALKIVD